MCGNCGHRQWPSWLTDGGGGGNQCCREVGRLKVLVCVGEQTSKKKHFICKSMASRETTKCIRTVRWRLLGASDLPIGASDGGGGGGVQGQQRRQLAAPFGRSAAAAAVTSNALDLHAPLLLLPLPPDERISSVPVPVHAVEVSASCLCLSVSA